MKEHLINRKDKFWIFAVIISTVIMAPRIESFFLTNILPKYQQGTHEAGMVAATATFASIVLTMAIIILASIIYKKNKNKFLNKRK